MPTKFTHEERVMFDDMIAGFDDMLVIGKAAETYSGGLDAEGMERTLDKFWLPMPLISASFDGFDQTANFMDATELNVPVSIGYHKSIPLKLSSKNLRNATYLRNKGTSAKQRLASDINLALFNTVALQGSLVSKRTAAATGFDDVALADAMMTEIGVPTMDRVYFAAPRVANLMAGDLAKRQTFSGEVQDAYERARVGIDIAGFDVFKNDQSIRLAAATGGAVTVSGANQYYVPTPYSVAATGEISNVDNRGQNLVTTGGTYANIKVGDAFTLPLVNSVHLITKQDTGQLLTFRVVGKPSAGVITIWPPIISNQGGSASEKEYQNCTATPAAAAPLTWLNTTTAELNPFFRKDALLLVPGSFVVDAEDGWNVMQATTELGIGVTYARQGEINDLSVKARWDTDFGTSLTNPQMAGVQLFGQA
jgi:hypothetical protein